MRNRIGFTLTEVLITLGIIGIVAALTIPSLITKYQKRVTALKLKETYSIITQAAKFYTADYGIGIEGFDTQMSSKNFIERYFAPYMKIIKVCTSVNECYPDKTPLSLDKKTKLLTPEDNLYNNLYMVTLLNGAYMTAYSSPAGTIFYIDLNGESKPNISGRDIFFLFLVNASTLGDYAGCESVIQAIKSGEIKTNIYPGGYGICYIPHATYTREDLLGTNVHRSCNPNSSLQSSFRGGDACAAVIMFDGWKISKDYPW